SGVYRGVSTPQGIEKWLGIRYAQAPTGARRFKAPVAVTASASSKVVNASVFGNACPQPPSNLGAPVGEDCIIQRSVANRHPIVFVSMYVLALTHLPFTQASTRNYRLNTFGFLSSAHVPPEDLNAGLLDQRMALEFVQKNIRTFGGDPDKVTIWGQSAGAGSVQAHLIYPSTMKLFRAAIADSSVGPFKTSPPASTYDEPDKPFAKLLDNVGCSTESDALACLRAVPFETFMSISNSMIDSTLNQQLWEPSVGPRGSLVPELASERIRRGDFLRVPYLSGTTINEGTLISTALLPLRPSTPAENDALFVSFVRACLIDNSTLSTPVLNQLRAFFRQDDSTLGAPFNTGNKLFDRAEAWYTAQMFLGPRRLFFEHASQGQSAQVWGYYFGEFIPGNNITLG
ncbi:hypothetical protein H0H87_005837, partial [Tephrocybe sp. NHM501043]